MWITIVETTLRARCYVMFCEVTLGYIMWKTICYVFFLCIELLDVGISYGMLSSYVCLGLILFWYK